MSTVRAFLGGLSLLMLLGGCGPGKPLFKNKSLPPARRPEALLAAIPEQNFQRLRYSGTGTWEQGGDQQRFRFDLRLIRDSVLWVDLSDPMLGIKAARAILRPDTALFYNRLRQEYLAGRPEQLAREVKLSFQFRWLWPLLTAQALPLGENYYLRRDSGRYTLSDQPLDKAADNPATTTVLTFNAQAQLREQLLHQPQAQRSLRATYRQFHPQKALPSKLTLMYKGNRPGRLTLNMRRIQPGEAFNLPFSIPDGYAPIE
ncbi:MAG: DUF4292 domain-containing protein [Schleiferiaceae bacterium]|nr:DUF4292 domain-containing protein [Schleiferiaceae bacterium]